MTAEDQTTAAFQAAPSVSVIIATYNHERFLAQAIQSVVDQVTSFQFEIIITEDCSTDGTLAIAKNYETRFPHLITILASTTNQNNSDVFVRAINHASGKYIAYLDGDDYWISIEKLQRQFDFLEENPDCCMVHHSAQRVSEDGVAIRGVEGFTRRATIEDLIQGNPVASCSVMMRRSAITPVPDWFSRIKAGDWAIYMIAAQHGWIGRIEGVLGHYRIHDAASWATTPVEMQWTMSLEMLDEIEKHIDTKYRPAFVRSRSHMIQELRTAIAERASLAASEISTYERERRAKEMTEQAARDIASATETKVRLRDTLMESQSSVIKAQNMLEETRLWQLEREQSFSVERHSLEQALAFSNSLVRKAQRDTRRAAVAGGAVSLAFAAALALSLWLR